MKFYKSSLNFNGNIATYKKICGFLGTDFYIIWWFVFFNFWPPLLQWAITFSISIPFLMIFNVPDVPTGGFKFCLNTPKKWSLPLGSNLPWMLKCYSCNSIATNEHLKDLTHMLCFRISCYKLYKGGLFSYVLTFKYMCHFGMSLKNLI